MHYFFMVGNVLKTIGICLTSLGSFNIQNKPNELINTQTRIETDTMEHDYTIDSSYNYQDNGTDIQARYMHREGILTTQNMTINWFEFQEKTYFTYDYSIDPRAEQDPTGPKRYYKNNKYMIIKIHNSNNVLTYPETQLIQGNVMCADKGYNDDLYFDTDYMYYTTYNTGLDTYMTPLLVPTGAYDGMSRQWAMMNLRNNIYVEKTTQYTMGEWSVDITYDLANSINIQKNPNDDLYIVITWNFVGNTTLENLNYEFEDITIKMSTTDAVIEQEVIDVPGLMFDVLTMPFTFWSGAFNLTLFPGTPYQLNISSLLLALLSVAIFVFLIKKTIGK